MYYDFYFWKKKPSIVPDKGKKLRSTSFSSIEKRVWYFSSLHYDQHYDQELNKRTIYTYGSKGSFMHRKKAYLAKNKSEKFYTLFN